MCSMFKKNLYDIRFFFCSMNLQLRDLVQVIVKEYFSLTIGAMHEVREF